MIIDFRKVVPYTDFLSQEEVYKAFTEGYMSGYTMSTYGKGELMSAVQLTEEESLAKLAIPEVIERLREAKKLL